MSRYGLELARSHADDLPIFDSQQSANQTLLEFRDLALKQFLAITALKDDLDYSCESLKIVEKWYFEAGRSCKFTEERHSITGLKLSTPLCIGFYFGETLCRVAGFQWIVSEFAFAQSHYEIGVERRSASGSGAVTIMLTRGRAPGDVGNKRMQSLFREVSRYAADRPSGV